MINNGKPRVKRRAVAFIASLALAGTASLATAVPGSAEAVPTVGTWTPTSNGLSLVRYSFRATTLLDGRVLVEGGFAPGSYTTEAEIYDPATNSWTVVRPMNQGRGEQTATLLDDGRVLVAGGYAGPVLSSAEIFDPSTGQWQVTGSMHVNRTRQGAVRLCDGRVLDVGGWNGQAISAAEIYDPSTGRWSLTGSFPVPVQGPVGILLPDCTVLFAGGAVGPSSNPVPMQAAYIFHPDTGTFTATTSSMHYARAGNGIAPLPGGKVLVMGGDATGTTAEVFDPATQQWSDVASMHDSHALGNGEDAQALPDGQVLVPGDATNGLEAELYDPATNTWSFTGPQNAVHYGGVTALLHDGRVLNAGGMDSARNLTPAAETYTLTPPEGDLAIAAPTGITANAVSTSGATVSYPLPAVTDPDDASAPAPDCSPAAGSAFPVGTTTVTCTATDPDDSNSPVTASFTVTVKGASGQVSDLHQAVQGVGPGQSLSSEVQQAESYLAAGDITDASSTLDAFINEVTAQTGKKIPAQQASQLIADARRIQAAMGASGWAGPSFCASYGAPYMGTTYYGVAACGNAYPDNYQGNISYHGVQLDSVGFQCAELTARYFYYLTGQNPPLVADASQFAYSLNASYGYNVYPAGQNQGTSTFQSSLAPGQIISMWSGSDQVGHVAVVTAVNITGENGTITVIGENGSASGTDTITVSSGQMSYEGIYNDFQWTTNMPS